MKFKKLYGILLLLPILVSIFTSCITAKNTSCSWFIKRNGTSQPILAKEQEIIYKYNAYYIDNSLSDNSENKVLYLTYDAGYENGNIEKTLDILKKENVPAAFFILDNILLKNCNLVTRMIEEGHLVCNHTKKHKNLSNATPDEIKDDLSALETLYFEKTGEKMKKYFRFPEGKYSEKSLKTISDLGYKTFFWSFAYDDWNNNKQMSEEKAFEKIISNTHNGAIFLFHPTSDTNVKILERLIKEWKCQGYEFGTLDELVANKKADAI